MICDNFHWVKTKWGNISLSLATIMAIEYAMKNKPYTYYKKIVFLQQCLPLYNYDVIKREFIAGFYSNHINSNNYHIIETILNSYGIPLNWEFKFSP